MEYMLLLYETRAEAARQENPTDGAYWDAWGAYVGDMFASGFVKSGHGLRPTHTTTTVRVEGGRRQVKDGPYADTPENLGGYFVVDVPSLDAALELAARAPCAVAGRAMLKCGRYCRHRRAPLRPKPPGYQPLRRAAALSERWQSPQQGPLAPLPLRHLHCDRCCIGAPVHLRHPSVVATIAREAPCDAV